LYTYRFPLEDQGVLVVGPNRVFLRYIEQVLPSLGEAGVEQVVLADLVSGHRVGRHEDDATRHVKGDIRMCTFVAAAVRDRERPLRDDLVVPFGAEYLRLRVTESVRIIRDARRRYRRHNAAARWVETEVVAAMAATSKREEIDLESLRDSLRDIPEFRAAIIRMWPVLTPAEVLHDVFGSRALVRSAAQGVLSDDEWPLLVRERSASLAEVHWAESDVALLDEVLSLIGPRPRKGGRIDENDEMRLYGHIIIDEVQDLTPMQLRMMNRRSLNGAMTIVGDLAQATGAFAPRDWQDVLKYLPTKREAQIINLSVGYRIPAQIMALADKVLAVAAPSLVPPQSVRDGEFGPDIVRSTTAERLLDDVVAQTRIMMDSVTGGNVAIVCPDAMTESVSAVLTREGVQHGRANNTALDSRLTVVPVSVVKGLELDGVVVVEPAAIVAAQEHGLRALYVALTRSTQRLTVVHHRELPSAMVN
jgi:DNA helicase IV